MTEQTTQPTRLGGRVLTFYSFKGGVGRTMALANTAFLAAVNGARVLVMDWDLEAPGLAYYFRGMQEGAGARAIRTAPGVLDLVWEWSSSVRGAATLTEVEALSDRFATGAPFEAAVRPLIADLDLRGGCLDLIGAGGTSVATPELTSYEGALARFDWSAFFAEEAGGSMLANLREWGKRNYDYVLIDSRTGFADVAGVCTIQIPDIVVLCFVYNRQNIDGVAQVAAAIRHRRGSEVEIRPAPMRVARENTPEEADARARARRELTRRGSLTVEQFDRGLKFLSVRAAANVPFYETVAPVASDRPSTDPLVFNYLTFASELLGRKLEIPNLDEEWVLAVSRRLQPRQATTDYVIKLRSSDQDRAVLEVTQLLEGALEGDDAVDGDDDYLKALVEVAIHLARDCDAFDALPIYTAATDLLRQLAEASLSWKPLLADALQSFLENASSALEPDEELLLLDEADGLLASQTGPESRLKRIANRRRAARVQLDVGQFDVAEQTVGELQKILQDPTSPRHLADRSPEIVTAEVDAQLLRGDISAWRDDPKKARKHYEYALKVAPTTEAASRPELVRLRFEVHSRLARLPSSTIAPPEAARHAVEALRWKSNSLAFVVQFLDLWQIVNAAGDPEMSAALASLALTGDERIKSQLSSYFGRVNGRTSLFLECASKTLAILQRGGERFRGQAAEVIDTSIAVLERAGSIPNRPRGPKPVPTGPLVQRLLQAVSEMGMTLSDSSVTRLAALDAKTGGRDDRTASQEEG